MALRFRNLPYVYMSVRFYSAPVGRRTVYAVASGKGKCGVSVLRVSGTAASQALFKLCRFRVLPNPRQAILRKIVDPKTNELLDKGLIIWFPGPGSFTGEDCCEFHVHGGSAVISSVMTALAKVPQLQVAEPGEFTKRAFYNGKLDLTEVEGLADLINAETENQRRQAVQQMDGALSKLYQQWAERLLKCLAHVEAYIDFSEDDNIEEHIIKSVSEKVQDLHQQICKHLNDNRRGERLRSGVNVAIVGEPNVGKSTLLNTICQRPAAIVSPIAGTTRDVVDVALDIGGFPIVFGDTAGLRKTDDFIEKEGVKRAKNRAEHADLIILIVDAGKLVKLTELSNFSWRQFMHEHISNLGLEASVSENANTMSFKERERLGCEPSAESRLVHTPVLTVINKLDLLPRQMSVAWKYFCNQYQSCVAVSCATGDNIEEFITLLREKIKEMCANPLAENPLLTNARHRIHLSSCVNHMQTFDTLKTEDIVLAAESLRLAMHQLGKITGKINPEQVLDVIFKDFCIGK